MSTYDTSFEPDVSIFTFRLVVLCILVAESWFIRLSNRRDPSFYPCSDIWNPAATANGCCGVRWAIVLIVPTRFCCEAKALRLSKDAAPGGKSMNYLYSRNLVSVPWEFRIPFPWAEKNLLLLDLALPRGILCCDYGLAMPVLGLVPPAVWICLSFLTFLMPYWLLPPTMGYSSLVLYLI
jgi:hypothetical protein